MVEFGISKFSDRNSDPRVELAGIYKKTSLSRPTWRSACNAVFEMNSNPPSPLPLNATSTTKDQAIKVKGARGRAFSAPLVSCVDVSPSCYSPLPEGCIRLLRLIPHQDKDAPIQCDLFNYPLLDSGEGIRPYDALSYAWGSSKKTRVISMDKHHISVTENLHIALSHLRDRFIERIIWVDAICINQSDIEERSHQVRFMTMIYAKASRVNVWLGEMEADSDQALEEIHRAAEEQSTKIDQRFQDAIFKLLQRPWFKRMWVSKSTVNRTGRSY